MLISIRTVFNLLLLLVLAVIPCVGVCIEKSTTRQPLPGIVPFRSRINPSKEDAPPSRRREILRTTSAILLGAASSLSTPTTRPAMAAEGGDGSAEILLRLRSIPTFSIVDPNGVPFMIFDGRASATGYFFLSFQVAAQALQDARQKDTNAGASELWSNAKIIVVPLAVALQLALRKSQREAVNNGIKFNAFNDIVPSQEGVDDAKEIETNDGVNSNPGKWEQKGRVPLFYIPGLTLADGREPRYFNRKDLLLEWDRQYPGTSPPPIQIVELVELFRVGLKNNDLSSLAKLAIMPVQETNQIASKLLKANDGATLPSYNFNKVFLVGSSQG